MLSIIRLVFIGFYSTTLAMASSGIASKYPIYDRFKYEIPVSLYEGNYCSLTIRGEAVVECYRGVRLSEIFYVHAPIQIKCSSQGLEVFDQNGLLAMGLAEIRLKPHDNASVVVYDSRGYRGYLRALFFDDPPVLNLMNMVMIEDYLKGVLPAEIGNRSQNEFEAAKAQAVAARTYAVWKLTDFRSNGKLAPTIADQVYDGIDSEIPLLSKAVEGTRGEIMTYGGRAIAAYYHAVCGGRTSPVQAVWPEKPAASYLVGVGDKNYCKWAKTYSWTEEFELPVLKKNILKYFLENKKSGINDFDKILNITFIPGPYNKTDSVASKEKNQPHFRRKMEMKISTPGGVFSERSDKIRWVLRRAANAGSILPSTMFIEQATYSNGELEKLTIRGRGNGHGVGMCQCGAIGQARIGKNYHEILKHYYKKIKFSTLF